MLVILWYIKLWPKYTFWDLEKTVLHEIRVSGTVLSYIIAKKRGSFRVNGEPPVLFLIVSNYFSLN